MQLLKRDLHLLIKGMLPALLLTGLLLLVCGLAGFSAFKAGTDLASPVPVALVDEENSIVSRLCIGIVQDAEYVDELLSISKCEKDEAFAGLECGDYAAAIILPEDYTDKIMVGRECAGTIVLSEKAAYMSELAARIAALGERLLAAGQYGVFAGEELILSSAGTIQGNYAEYLKLSNTRLIDTALDLESEAFDTVILPYSGFGTDIRSHFALCWICFFVSLCGMFFTALYNADRDEELRGRLKVCGIGSGSFLLGKILWPFVFRVLLLAALLFAVKGFASVSPDPAAVLCAAAGLVLCTCFTTGLAVSFPKAAPWMALLVSLAGLFFCGGLLPLQYVPGFFFRAGRLFPLGAMAGITAPVFGGKISASALLASLFWAAASVAGALVSLSRRRGKEGNE